MIVITVEMWPGGDEESKRVMARGAIVNDGTSTDMARGNYDAVFCKTTSPRRRCTKVEQFPRRSRDVWELLRRALNQVEGKAS